MLQPTLENDFGRETGKNINVILDTIGAAGIFWDEHQRFRVNYSYNSEHWDGCSGEINLQNFTLERLKRSLALVSLPRRLEKAKYIMSRATDYQWHAFHPDNAAAEISGLYRDG